MTYRLLLCLLLSGIGIVPARAQSGFAGRIVDLESGLPLIGVFVDILPVGSEELPTQLRTWTDTEGRYYMGDVPNGKWRLNVRYFEDNIAYVLTGPETTLDGTMRVQNVELPVSLLEYLENEQPPVPSTPKSLALVTGTLPEGSVRDFNGTILPGSQGIFKLETTGSLYGRVSLGSVAAIQTYVQLRQTRWETVTDDQGRWRIDDIVPGRYGLRLISGADTLDTPPVDIRAGQTEWSIDLSR